MFSYLKWLLGEGVGSWLDPGLDCGWFEDAGGGLPDEPRSGVVPGDNANAQAEESVTVVQVDRAA